MSLPNQRLARLNQFHRIGFQFRLTNSILRMTMSINKSSSVSNSNSGFIPGSEVKNNYDILDPIIRNKKSRNSKNMDSKTSKIKEKSKSGVTIGLNFENGSTQTQYISGSVKNLINQINNYKIPETNKNVPVDIYISYNSEEIKKLNSKIILKNGKISVLFSYFLDCVKLQLMNKSDQIISTKLAANILNIRHFALLNRIKMGHIPTRKVKNQLCVRSDDLFKLKEEMDKSCNDAMKKLLQDDY